MDYQKPFLKWVGGKSQILDKILGYFPSKLNSYHEIFLGGGSVLLAVLSLQKGGNFQIEGDMLLEVFEAGKRKKILIREGELFLLPKNVPHSPQRFKDTIGLVIEYKRDKGVLDYFQWYCDNCDHLLHEVSLDLKDIVSQLPPLFDKYWEDINPRTCKKCLAIQKKPIL